MKATFHHRPLALLLTLAITLALLPSAGPATRAATVDCDGPLHPKSAAGLMPPACGLDSDAATTAAAAPAIDLFKAPINTAVGSWAQVLAADDFNGDNQDEAAVATGRYFDPENDDSLHLFGLNGSAFTGLQQLPAGDSPEAALATDLDLDGDADIALALAGDDALAVYTQTTAKQPLNGPELLSLPGAPDALATGDFTGDLRNDLAAVAPLSDTIAIYASNADDLLPEAVTLPFATDGYSALAAGDLNNDGQDDLAALRGSGYATDSVVVFLQDNGTFPISYTLSPRTGGYLPHSLAVGDVTSDGLDDLVVTAGGNTPDAYISVFVQGMVDPPTAPPKFRLADTPVVYDAYHLPSAVEIADINHDGREDVVLVNDSWRALSVYPQQADGMLDAYAVAEIPYSSRYRPNALALADFDGNGGLDVGVVGQTPGLTVLTNKASTSSATITAPADGATIMAGTQTVSGTVTASAVKVEVRIKGFTNWQTATLNGTSWQADITLPSHSRTWWIEARATNAQGRVQAPPARHRVRVNGRVTDGLLVLYDFAENSGTTVHDVSGVGEPLDLTIDDPTATTWMTSSLTIEAPTIIKSPEAATKIIDTLGETNEVTLEAWIVPANITQDGPARIVTISEDSKRQNISLGQGLSGNRRSDLINMRLRTTETSAQFTRDRLMTPPGSLSVDLTHIIYTRDVSGRACIYLDGEETACETLTGDLSNWNQDYHLALANEVQVARPWLGTLYLVAFYQRALNVEEIQQNFAAGPTSDGVPPTIDSTPFVRSLQINDWADSTSDRSVNVTVAAEGAAIQSVLFMEYAYNQVMGQWDLTQRSTWLSYQDAATPHSWTLTEPAGVKYLQAWVLSKSGEVSRYPYQAFINYLPDSDTLAQNQVRVYRYALAAGEQLNAQVTPQSGDADLYVWAPETTPDSPWVSNQRSGVDLVSFVAPVDGIYQVEVHGFTATTFGLTIAVTPAVTALRATTPTQNIISDKQLRSRPVIPLDSVPSFDTRPTRAPRVLLPILGR